MSYRRWIPAVLAMTLMLLPSPALAQDRLTVNVDMSTSCTEASFAIEVEGGSIPYTFNLDFGDGDEPLLVKIDSSEETISHLYPAQGRYEWQLTVEDDGDLQGQASGSVVIDGPTVTLMSDPFPPLLPLEDGAASVSFTAEVTGGQEPYVFTWDLDGNGTAEPGGDPSNTASFIYTAGGKYLATVRVEDGCGLVDEDTLPVVIIDPDEEACHPTAQKIADAVNTLFPGQADSLYTCEDIYDIFRGGLTGSQVGYGRMWHAYKLAETMDELTWEEIRDWHLDGNGWGILTQLDRYAESLGEVGLRELFDRVLSGEATLGDIRSAVRAVVRYEADFEDALARAALGLSPGDLGQFYRTVQALEIDPETLDGYLESGLSLTELRHAGRLAERTGSDWSDIAEAHGSGHSWGEINQAHRLADSENDWQAVLAIGPNEYRSQQREQARLEQQAGQSLKVAERLAERYGLEVAQVMAIYEGNCSSSWSCVRAELRSQSATESNRDADRDERTAAKLASQYGVSEAQVWSLYNDDCSGDWSCVRAALREQARGEPGRGKKPKN